MKRPPFDVVHQLGAIHDALQEGETVIIQPGSVRAREIAQAMKAADAEEFDRPAAEIKGTT